jgi:hypothetical protein
MDAKATAELISAVVSGHDQLIARMYLAAALINEGDKVEAGFKEAQSRLKEAKAKLAEVQKERDAILEEVEALRTEHAQKTGELAQIKENLEGQIKEEAA